MLSGVTAGLWSDCSVCESSSCGLLLTVLLGSLLRADLAGAPLRIGFSFPVLDNSFPPDFVRGSMSLLENFDDPSLSRRIRADFGRRIAQPTLGMLAGKFHGALLAARAVWTAPEYSLRLLALRPHKSYFSPVVGPSLQNAHTVRFRTPKPVQGFASRAAGP